MQMKRNSQWLSQEKEYIFECHNWNPLSVTNNNKIGSYAKTGCESIFFHCILQPHSIHNLYSENIAFVFQCI